jgi:hypothetical protein
MNPENRAAIIGMELGLDEARCCVGSVKAYTVHKSLSIFQGSLSEMSGDIDSYGSAGLRCEESHSDFRTT